MTRRELGLALTATALMAGCGPHYEKPLMVGTNLWTGYEPLYLARDLGYYDGLPLRLVELASTTQALDALRVGRLDIAALTLDETLLLAQEQADLSIIWVMNISAGADAVLARPGIQHLEQLPGLRIGVEQTALGAYMLQALLTHAKLKARQVEIVPLPADEHLPAWRNGEVDALVTFDPMRQTLLEEGAQLLFDSRSLPGEVVDVLVARDAALACCGPQITQLLQGQSHALAHLQNHRTQALVRMARRPGVAPASVATALEGLILPDAAANHLLLTSTNEDGLQHTLQKLSTLMVQRGLLQQRPLVFPTIDPRFALQAHQTTAP